MEKLAAYLFYVKFLGRPGDISRGRALFEARSCSRCHQFAGRGGTVGPRLDDLKEYMTSFFMARALWNHGPKMAEKLEELKLERPQFEPRDVTDIVAFIRGESRPPDALDLAYSQAGSPRAGAVLFEKKGCIQCHSVAGKGGGMGPDLDEQGPGLDISEIAGTFWNHGPVMWEKMREVGVPFPELSDREMSDIFAYLALRQYQGPKGNADRGRKLFDEKACSRCHGPEQQGPKPGKGPALSPAARSTLVWAASIWNGAPAMARQLAEDKLDWPQLQLDEVRDLIEFLHPPEDSK
jgi:nitric oxide reductase subunit C